MAHRLKTDRDGLDLCRQRQELGDNLSQNAKEHIKSAAETLHFLQLLCEGHCLLFQNYLREQRTRAFQIDLVGSAIDLFIFLVDSSQAAALFSKPEENLEAGVLDFLTETMLGPCAGNQVQVARVEVLGAVNSLISARWRPPYDPTGKFGLSGQAFNEDLSPNSELASGLRSRAKDVFFAAFGRDLRCRACHMIAACLEGRDDKTTHTVVLHRLECTGLKGLSRELERDVRAIYTRASIKRRLPTLMERAAAEAMECTLSAIQTVIAVFDAADDDTTSAGMSNVSLTLGLKWRGVERSKQ